MGNMLGKIMKLVVMVREDYLGTLVDLLEKVAGKDAENWVKNLRLFLRKETVDWDKKVISFLRIVKSGISLGLTPSAKTVDCFQEGFAFRDSDIDSWMTDQVPAVEGGVIVCHELTEDGHTFMEMAHELLSLKTSSDEASIAKSLFEQGKTFSLKQVEELHKRFVAGETEIGFNTNGYANLFLVHDEKGRVFVLRVGLGSRGWRLFVDKLGRSDGWSREIRLFSRN